MGHIPAGLTERLSVQFRNELTSSPVNNCIVNTMNSRFRNSIIRQLYVAVFSAVAVACAADRINTDCCNQDDRIVSFSVAPFDGTTKGIAPLENTNLYTMGVFAGYETEDVNFGSSSLSNDYINNVRYTRPFITSPFAGSDVCYWPFSGKLSFFAYAPFISNELLQVAPDYVSGYPRLNYSPTADVSNQPDFCIADPMLDQHPTAEPIPLVFHHSLSQILFSANYSGEFPPVSDGLYVKVDSIRICNVIGKKTVSVNSGNPCFVWQDDSECPATNRVSYLVDRQKNQQIKNEALPEVTDPGTDNYMELTTFNGVANGVMYLLPQSMDYGDVYLKVTYGYYEIVGTAEILRASVSTTCPLPAVTWEPTKAYRYKFTIDIANNIIVSPSISVEPWIDVNNTEASPIHIE